MTYNNYPYNFFNQDTMSQYSQQPGFQRYHNEQQKNILDMVKALSDFIDAAQKISPEYRQRATDACFAELFRRMTMNNGGY
jgi:hypothetical protein